jgi:hypothetical protein
MSRYVRKDRRIYDFSACRLCGTCWGAATGAAKQGAQCAPSTCMACGSTQCQSNGLGNGRCSICYIGILPNWSGWNQDCRYKGCGKQAIAVDGAWPCCAEHIERRKPGYIAAHITARDYSWILVDDTATARVALLS